MRRYPLPLVLALVFCLPTLLSAEEWPQFRGVNAAGISTESMNLPVQFSVDEKVLWSTEIGEGIGSPVISKGRLCITTMVGKERFAVLCLDAATGKE
ncbi:MAG: PQQ-binding-like beta-propeller repeat protein, partial [Pirellulaceae bacterium]